MLAAIFALTGIIIAAIILIYNRSSWAAKDEVEREYLDTATMTVDDYYYFTMSDVDIAAPFVKKFPAHERYIRTLANNPIVLCKIILMKLWYNRKRPDSFLHKVKSKTAFGGSYPSGHAYLANYIAEQLAARVPEEKLAIFTIAKRIAECRVKAGLHYPSDVSSSLSPSWFIQQQIPHRT